MNPEDDPYADFVEHPRYGCGPRVTGLNPKRNASQEIFFHWWSEERSRIPGTAIVADIERQSWATYPVSHYFDETQLCEDCGRKFLFFAEEQKHWYEVLGLNILVQCVRCVQCRKKLQGIARKRQRFEDLFHVAEKSVSETLEMAECCLSLIESGTFSPRQHEKVRALLNKLPEDLVDKHSKLRDQIRARLQALHENEGRSL